MAKKTSKRPPPRRSRPARIAPATDGGNSGRWTPGSFKGRVLIQGIENEVRSADAYRPKGSR
jgi:hypothetical protein